MPTMKRSEILLRVLIALLVAFVVAVFVIPQETLDKYEFIFLWVLMPVIGALWIRLLIDATRGN